MFCYYFFQKSTVFLISLYVNTQGTREGIDTSRPSLLQPINTSSQGQSEGEKPDHLRGKPIPPITSSKPGDPGASGDGMADEDDNASER